LISNHFGDSVGGPEKAGVGGSIPSLATNNFNNLATAKKRVRISRAHNTRVGQPKNEICLADWFESFPNFPRHAAAFCFSSFTFSVTMNAQKFVAVVYWSLQ
jgi:hypothetical protein